MTTATTTVVEVLDPESVALAGFGERHGNYVTQEDAYQTYVATGARSLRRTADILGLPYGTVLSWNRRYNWQAKVRSTDIEMTEGLAQAAAVAAVSQGLRAIETLGAIAHDENQDPRARVEAAKELLKQFNGITALVAGSALVKGAEEDLTEADLEEEMKTPEGVARVLERQRQRTGRG